MAFRSFKKDIDLFYKRIDKIAKVGRDNFQEYYNFVDDCISKSQYGIFTQVLYLKYDFDYTKYLSVDQIKTKSWNAILFRTNTGFQDDKHKLLKQNSLYQVGKQIWQERTLTQVKVIDPGIGGTAGSGADLLPIISNDSNRGIIRIDVIKTGKNYSTASYVSVVGGNPSATASVLIRGGLVLTSSVIASGSNHNTDYKLAKVEEVDLYIKSIEPLEFTNDTSGDLKITYLEVTKEGATMSASFSTWNFKYDYDKNMIELYKQAVDYII